MVVILPSRAFRSFPRRLLSAVFARSNLASWSRMPSFRSPLWAGRLPYRLVTGVFAAMLLELASQQVGVGGLAAETVPILSLAPLRRLPAATKSLIRSIPGRSRDWPRSGRGLAHLLKGTSLELQRAAGGAPSASKLLGEGVAAPCLLVGGHTGVEDSLLGAVAVRARGMVTPSVEAR